MGKLSRGRVPAGEQKDSSDFDWTKVKEDRLRLDAKLKEELEAKGYAYRFINAKMYQQEYGFHRSGWKVYKTDSTAKQGSLDFGLGVDSEGYVRRGDLVLAVKPKELQEKHKKGLRMRAANQSNYNKQKAAEMRMAFKEGGLNVKIHEGYDENGEETPEDE